MGLLACSIPPEANTCLLSHQPKAQNRFLCPQLKAGRVFGKATPSYRETAVPTHLRGVDGVALGPAAHRHSSGRWQPWV